MLTSAASTREALGVYALSIDSGNGIPKEPEFTSNIFNQELVNQILNSPFNTQEVSLKVIDAVKEIKELEYNEVVDLKIAYFIIAQYATKDLSGLEDLHKRAFVHR